MFVHCLSALFIYAHLSGGLPNASRSTYIVAALVFGLVLYVAQTRFVESEVALGSVREKLQRETPGDAKQRHLMIGNMRWTSLAIFAVLLYSYV